MTTNHQIVDCPYCGGSVPLDTTTICPYCQEDLSALAHLEYIHAIHYNQALSLAREDKLDEARERLLLSLEVKENFAPSHILLAKIYARQRQWVEAKASIARAMELSPDNETVRELAREIELAAQRAGGMAAHETRERVGQFLAAHQREVVRAFGVGIGLMAFIGIVLFRLFRDDDGDEE
ncbi:MAG: hypothetical protein A2Y73_04815 [Chloroflexi bacterium RBG_13_56_8]|nr:MAG: hypothetical protein A2Y73_04815 [Chloroflexi bacterium RBG_13_56_8]